MSYPYKKVHPQPIALVMVCVFAAYAAPIPLTLINYFLSSYMAPLPFVKEDVVIYTGLGLAWGMLPWWGLLLITRQGNIKTIAWPTFWAGVSTALMYPIGNFWDTNFDWSNRARVVAILLLMLFFFVHGAVAGLIFLALSVEKSEKET